MADFILICVGVIVVGSVIITVLQGKILRALGKLDGPQEEMEHE